MNKTINVNIGGLFFHMDETAYHHLKKYLDAITYSLRENEESRKEILDDIESRISELLTERITNKRQVVSKNDIDEIIKIMGKPEDYLVDDELFNDDEIPPKKSKIKKLFRDMDNKYLGGVCSGLAHYISIDAVWVRLIFIVLLLSGLGMRFGDYTLIKIGFFPLIFVYILLWILIPPAQTTAEKLEMKGKPVTITNIEEKVKEEQYKSSPIPQKPENQDTNNQINKAYERPKTPFFKRLADILVGFFGFLFKLIGKMIGIALIIGSCIGFIAICIGLFSWGSFEILGISDEFMRIPDEIYGSILPSWAILTTIFILIAIPLFGFLLLGLKIISHRSNLFNKPTWLTLLALWLISLFIFIFWVIDVASQTKYHKNLTEIKELPYLEKDTIFVSVKPYYNYNKELTKKTANIRLTDISISKDDKAQLIIEKYAKGRNNNDAIECAKNMKYESNVSNNILLFDNHFQISKKELFRADAIFLKLKVPKNMVISFDYNTRILTSYNTEKKYNIKFDKNKNHYYKVTENGIEPTEETLKLMEKGKSEKQE
ncbi:MAG: PspC domain-containing protein [Flavobacteriaceae bacterium]|nr:PspC domain-containing protein [Flavobacteriaceae bacterium]